MKTNYEMLAANEVDIFTIETISRTLLLFVFYVCYIAILPKYISSDKEGQQFWKSRHLRVEMIPRPLYS